MSQLSGYSDTILIACIMFLPVAALFTLPFMVYQYRKYGSIPILRVLIVYSFILYMMCAFLLTVLPLPSAEQLSGMTSRGIQFIPFSTYADALKNAGLDFGAPGSLSDIANWKAFLKSGGLFEILANIVMQIPLGIYLRYYFKLSLKQTLLCGFLVSLLYELTQLTGLWFIYSHSYRLCSVDDLFDNTLGCVIGYLITPLFALLLPNRDELDRISIARERRATVTRRVCAILVDWLFWAVVIVPVLFRYGNNSGRFFEIAVESYVLWAFVVMVLLQRLTNGLTIGKKLLRIKLVSARGGKPGLRQLLIRYFAIYILAPLWLCVCAMMALALAAAVISDSEFLRFSGIIGLFILVCGNGYAFLHTLKKHGELPHSIWSGTRIVLTGKAQRKRVGT